jgi:hypothetical protein
MTILTIMLLKPLLPFTLFSLATFVVVATSGTASNVNAAAAAIERTLQSSILCLASGIDFIDCCPSGPDPNDGACTLLSCVNFDNVTIRDDCDCSQLEVACGQVAVFADLVANLYEMCIAVDNCCDDGGADTTLYSKVAIVAATTTSNSEFETCMASTIDDSGMAIPDIDALLPGGDGISDSKSASSTGTGAGTDAMTTTTSTTTIITTSTTSTSLPQQKTVELAVNANDATESVAYMAFFVISFLSLAMI